MKFVIMECKKTKEKIRTTLSNKFGIHDDYGKMERHVYSYMGMKVMNDEPNMVIPMDLPEIGSMLEFNEVILQKIKINGIL